MILALDLGTFTGYAVGGDDLPPRSGVLNLKDIEGDHAGAKFLRLLHHLDRLHKQYEFTEIYYEHVGYVKFAKASQMWGGFQAYLYGWAMLNKVPAYHVEISTLKKFATDNGNANKDMMVAAAVKKGWPVSDDNEADALWILEYAIKPAPVAPLFEDAKVFIRGSFGYHQTKFAEPTLHRLNAYGLPICDMKIKSSKKTPWTISWVEGYDQRVCSACDERHAGT